MTIFFDPRDQLFPQLRRIYTKLLSLEQHAMATQADVRQSLASLHTALTDAVARNEAFNKAQADNIESLKQQLADLTTKVENADIPDDIASAIMDAKTLADTIETAPLEPPAPPEPAPVPTPEPTPTPNP